MIIGVLIALLVALGVAIDASHRYRGCYHPSDGSLPCGGILIVALPIYLICRPERLED